MAFGAVSAVFSSYLHDVLANTSASDIDTDALMECALFDNSITPDKVATAANSAYGGGTWAGGHITDTGTGAPAGWPTLGRPLTYSPAVRWTAATSNPLIFDSDDVVSASATTTLAATYGCLIYNHTAGTPTDEGLCFLSFNGSNTVTLGTFTVVFAAGGVVSIAV